MVGIVGMRSGFVAGPPTYASDAEAVEVVSHVGEDDGNIRSSSRLPASSAPVRSVVRGGTYELFSQASQLRERPSTAGKRNEPVDRLPRMITFCSILGAAVRLPTYRLPRI